MPHALAVDAKAANGLVAVLGQFAAAGDGVGVTPSV